MTAHAVYYEPELVSDVALVAFLIVIGLGILGTVAICIRVIAIAVRVAWRAWRR